MISPESKARAEVVLTVDTDTGSSLVNFAHSRCHRSQVEEVPRIVIPDELDTSWLPVLRAHGLPAVLLWELGCSIRSNPGQPEEVDPIGARLYRGGFRGATDRIGDLVAPLVRGWTVRLDGS
jgi:hypothetical protein